ncbi:MAG: aldehyde ferredoxin oxidoreductase family protein [Moorellales bacterium]
MGKLLFVDLSGRRLWEEALDEGLARSFLGGYGLGARLLYQRQRAGVDPLGPENILGFLTGPLTGTPATFGCRFIAVGKSPLTGGWGDANCGGFFGPHLKFAGYDGVFISGIAEAPVYLLIEDGKAELKDASELWGRTTYETERWLQSRHGPAAKVVSVGPAGENQCLIAAMLHHRGSAAARSGLGAVMGSKRVKAVVVRGSRRVPVASEEQVRKLRRCHLAEMQERKVFFNHFRRFGTSSHADTSAHLGDSPVKNWGGVGVVDLPDVSGLKGERFASMVKNRVSCWHCPVGCKATVKAGTEEYLYPEGVRRPEYETQAAFGAMCLNTNAQAIVMANHLCNGLGLDTISAGTTVAFAMECYEHGLITRSDTDGLELIWGNHRAIVALLEKMARREGFGAVLADGVKRAAERIGRGAEQFAVEVGGQEPGLHDPKFKFPPLADKDLAAVYKMDATPGRHTAAFGPTGFLDLVLQAAGLCLHSKLMVDDPKEYLVKFLNAVTGWNYSQKEWSRVGERIATIRHLFSLREGDNPLERRVHSRIIGRPPQKEGPLAGVSVDLEAQVYWALGALDWDPVTAKPSKSKLQDLGLGDLIADFWPE